MSGAVLELKILLVDGASASLQQPYTARELFSFHLIIVITIKRNQHRLGLASSHFCHDKRPSSMLSLDITIEAQQRRLLAIS
jgi:hypothetical protein